MRKYVVILLVLVVAVAAIAVVGCGSSGTTKPLASGSSTGDSDAAAVKTAADNFYKAAHGKNMATLKTLVTTSSVNTLNTKPELVVPYEEATITVAAGTPVVTGDTATVDIKLTSEGTTSTDSLVLSKENGSWKVDMDKSTFAK